MLVPKKLKLNKFVDVAIPRNSVLLGRLGLHEQSSNSFTGDDSSIPLMQDKLDLLTRQNAEMWEQYQKSMQESDSGSKD